jgi:hypothetical protein
MTVSLRLNGLESVRVITMFPKALDWSYLLVNDKLLTSSMLGQVLFVMVKLMKLILKLCSLQGFNGLTLLLIRALMLKVAVLL